MCCQRVSLIISMLLASLFGGAIGGLLFDSPIIAERVQGRDPLTTTQVNLVDSSGQLRAVLSGQDEQRMASLSFYDKEGQVRGVVGIDENNVPLISLRNPAGQSRLTASIHGENALVVVGDEAAHSGVFGSIEGRPILSLGDAGQSRVGLQLNGDGSPSLGFFDGDGRQSIALTVDGSGAGLMTFHEEGRVRAAFGLRDQTTLLNMGDDTQMRLVIGVAEDGRPSISFLSETGEITQELPLLQR